MSAHTKLDIQRKITDTGFPCEFIISFFLNVANVFSCEFEFHAHLLQVVGATCNLKLDIFLIFQGIFKYSFNITKKLQQT